MRARPECLRGVVGLVLLVAGGTGVRAGPQSSASYYVPQNLHQQQMRYQRAQVPLFNVDGKVRIGQTEYDRMAWEAAGHWKKQSPKESKGKWMAPDGSKYDSPQDGWNWRRSTDPVQYLAPGAGSGNWETAFGVDVTRTDVEYNTEVLLGPDEPESRVYMIVPSLTAWNESLGLALAVPLSREEYDWDYDVLDYTSAGLIATPFYRLLREEVHGYELDLSVSGGFSYQWYGARDQFDRPVTKPWGLGGFDDPWYLSAGTGVNAAKQLGPVRLNGALSQVRFWDMADNGDPEGEEHLDYTSARLGVQVPVISHVTARAEMLWSYSKDVPVETGDTTTVFGTASLEYAWRSCRVGVLLGRDLDDDSLDATAYGVTFRYLW